MTDLTYGGPRLVAPSHIRGMNSHLRGTVRDFWVVLEGGAWISPLTVFLADGTEAIALFSGEEEARMFCHFRSDVWTDSTIRHTTAGRILSLLYCPWSAKHVALDPLPRILERRLPELRALSRTCFARTFAGRLGSESVVR
jgi:hypothetical protein